MVKAFAAASVPSWDQASGIATPASARARN
jgi:hypothetical protein